VARFVERSKTRPRGKAALICSWPPLLALPGKPFTTRPPPGDDAEATATEFGEIDRGFQIFRLQGWPASSRLSLWPLHQLREKGLAAVPAARKRSRSSPTRDCSGLMRVKAAAQRESPALRARSALSKGERRKTGVAPSRLRQVSTTGNDSWRGRREKVGLAAAAAVRGPVTRPRRGLSWAGSSCFHGAAQRCTSAAQVAGSRRRAPAARLPRPAPSAFFWLLASPRGHLTQGRTELQLAAGEEKRPFPG